jgi:hypothetical protein
VTGAFGGLAGEYNLDVTGVASNETLVERDSAGKKRSPRQTSCKPATSNRLGLSNRLSRRPLHHGDVHHDGCAGTENDPRDLS